MSPPNQGDRIRELEQRISALNLQIRNLTTTNKEQGEKIEEQEGVLDELHATLQEAEKQLARIATAPWHFAYFLRVIDKEKRIIEVEGGANLIYILTKSFFSGADIDLNALRRGQILWLSAESVAVHATTPAEFAAHGELRIFESVQGNMLAVKNSRDDLELVTPAEELVTSELQNGDFVIVHSGIATKKITIKDIDDSLSANKPVKTFSMVGGLDKQIGEIKDQIIAPFLDPEGAKEFLLKIATEDAFIICALLFGPPGCGKTLMAEATATELSERCRITFGDGFKVGFILVRGPEMLNMWLGNTEAMMRDLFLKRTADFDLTVILWDEFGSTFPPRGMHSNAAWVSTHVAQFNSLVGAFKGTQRKVILLAADNRIDLIDPAVIRAGRFRIKIHVPRPNEIGVQQTLPLYLKPPIPLHKSCFAFEGQTPEEAINEMLIPRCVEMLFDPESEANNLIEVKFGTERRILGFKDLIVSGAFCDDLVERAKTIAYNRWVKTRDVSEKGLKLEDLERAFEEEASESKHLPDAEKALQDWLQTEGVEGEHEITFLQRGKTPKIGFTK
ncbi:MAG: AAA family ATPase [Candidatus Liptonbacteria bacterium]|nr:AAA family ATPase [Candidatus Liptonbacteria bacterium]